MKSAGAIFALALFLMPFLVTFTVLKIQKHEVKRTVKWKMIAGLDRNELVRFEFSEKEINQELRWEHSREFEYQGEMYDVVERESKGDTTVFWCWWDNEETKLNKQLTALTFIALGDHPSEQNKQRAVVALFKSMISNDHGPDALTFYKYHQKKFFERQTTYTETSAKPCAPPPEHSFLPAA
jgi:hypothetical protein